MAEDKNTDYRDERFKLTEARIEALENEIEDTDERSALYQDKVDRLNAIKARLARNKQVKALEDQDPNRDNPSAFRPGVDYGDVPYDAPDPELVETAPENPVVGVTADNEVVAEDPDVDEEQVAEEEGVEQEEDE